MGKCRAVPDQIGSGELTFENELFIGTGRVPYKSSNYKNRGKMLAVSDFLRGYTLKNGSQLDFPKVSL